MKIGLYFGTFDPIHKGHLMVAKQVIFEKIVDEIWFIVTPKSPFKKLSIIASKEQRFKMLKLAISQVDLPMSACDIEFKLPYPQYTSNTLKHLSKLYPDNIFHLIMGSDNYLTLAQWHDADFIINKFHICVYPRGVDVPEHKVSNTTFLSGDKINISSSFIRASFLDKMTNNTSSLDHKVLQYIITNNIY
jgi:nicotinate-nucleotide adenylyltransferase